MAGILITDGGSHSPEKWAVATAEQIFDISPNMAGDRVLAAKKLQAAIAEALMPHHAGVQDRERGTPRFKVEHLGEVAEAEKEADEAIASIVAAAKGTPWEDHFGDPDRLAVVRRVIASHFMTAKDIERQWHFHRNPGDGAAKAYFAARHPQ